MNLSELNYDCLGILSDFLSEDLNSLYFFDKNNLKPKGKPVDYSNIDWTEASEIKNISLHMVDFYKDNLNFDILIHSFKNNNDLEPFCELYADKIPWYDICSSMKLNSIFYENNARFSHKFKDYILWDKVSGFAGLDEGYICECADYLNWNIISGTIGLTPYLIERFQDKINFDKLTTNKYVDISLYEHLLESDDMDDKEMKEDEDGDIELGDNNNEEHNISHTDPDEDSDIDIVVQS